MTPPLTPAILHMRADRVHVPQVSLLPDDRSSPSPGETSESDTGERPPLPSFSGPTSLLTSHKSYPGWNVRHVLPHEAGAISPSEDAVTLLLHPCIAKARHHTRRNDWSSFDINDLCTSTIIEEPKHEIRPLRFHIRRVPTAPLSPEKDELKSVIAWLWRDLLLGLEGAWDCLPILLASWRPEGRTLSTFSLILPLYSSQSPRYSSQTTLRHIFNPLIATLIQAYPSSQFILKDVSPIIHLCLGHCDESTPLANLTTPEEIWKMLIPFSLPTSAWNRLTTTFAHLYSPSLRSPEPLPTTFLLRLFELRKSSPEPPTPHHVAFSLLSTSSIASRYREHFEMYALPLSDIEGGLMGMVPLAFALYRRALSQRSHSPPS